MNRRQFLGAAVAMTGDPVRAEPPRWWMSTLGERVVPLEVKPNDGPAGKEIAAQLGGLWWLVRTEAPTRTAGITFPARWTLAREVTNAR